MRRALSYVWWPLLFGLAVAATYAGVVFDHAIIVFNVTYVALAITIALLERAMPHEKTWLENDGQVVPDIAHTLLNKGVAQVIIVMFAFMGLAEYVASVEGGVWPVQWPLAVQVVLGLVLAEIGLYWKHRLAHDILKFSHIAWPPIPLEGG